MKQLTKKEFLTLDKNIHSSVTNYYLSDIHYVQKNGTKRHLETYTLFSYIQEIIFQYFIEKKYIDIPKIVTSLLQITENSIDLQLLANNLSFISAHHIENHYSYSKLASAFLIESLLEDIFTYHHRHLDENKEIKYKESFKLTIAYGIAQGIFTDLLNDFDINELAHYIDIKRDRLFDYIGIYTLYKRYFIKDKEHKYILETPQGFWMRIAMGMAIHEKNKTERAKEFYDILSQLLYTPSTPTLCHSGFKIAQLSSCYLNVVEDDLHDIFTSYSDSAQLAKWSGGIGTSWSKVRACGAHIKKIDIDSQGVIPYLKIEDDIICSISKTGTRRGGKAVYLDIWHYDVEGFLDLKKNTGDHRRRTHDLNTALWICDLFMERVVNNQDWTLFSPDETPLLLETYGKAFEEAFTKYEESIVSGKIKLYKIIPAKELWKKILTRIFETGHPWITFKDPCNIRSPQQHCGIVHSSNLCTEIVLNTSKTETAVCNIGSLNLSAHVNDTGKIDFEKLKNTIQTSVRILDNVIDITYYPIKSAAYANKKHRPIGLGVMGWQDVLFKKNLGFEDESVPELIDMMSEYISYHTILASSLLGKERGRYESFDGSLWSKGIFPHDTVEIVNQERKTKISMPTIKTRQNWQALRKVIKENGMRNSTTMAIAPTATISTIVNCFPSIEPIYKNLYVKSNMTGEFSIINKYLVDSLSKIGLWSEEIKDQIKFFNGSIQGIMQIPETIRQIFKTAFEIDQKTLLYLTALRGQWIDQSQSHNIFFEGTSGKLLDEIYKTAWQMGLKTTYYFRTMAKSQIEKSTLGAEYGLTQLKTTTELKTKNFCNLENEEGCESCQ